MVVVGLGVFYCDIDVSGILSRKVSVSLVDQYDLTMVHGIAIWGICFL